MKNLNEKKDNKFWKNQRVLITGAGGFLGGHLVERLRRMNPRHLFLPSSADFDLRMFSACKRVVKNIDIVIHLAAKVGGIGYNQKLPGEMFYDNIMMGVQLMEAARQAGVKKFVSIGTVCAYPKFTPTPFRESSLWNGFPEETNAPYGLAKKMLLVQGQAYRRQYGFNAIYLLPANLYGPGDNFDNQSSHVIPALIKKFVAAKLTQSRSVSVWGTGESTREFLYVDDAARGILLATERYDGDQPINLGTGEDITIKRLTLMIKDYTNFCGRIVWDTSKPNGQPRRRLAITKAQRSFGFKAKIPLSVGLANTIDWYLHRNKNEK